MMQGTQLAILAPLMIGLWRLGGVLLLIALAVLLFRHSRRARQTFPAGLRRGVCPGCESALFGTTATYRHLRSLNLTGPDSPYLCPRCDRLKVAALQRRSQVEHTDESP